MLGWFAAVLDLIFPPVCVVCSGAVTDGNHRQLLRWAGHGICPECFGTISWLRPPYCPICTKPISSSLVPSHPCGDCLLEPPPFKSARALMIYQDEIFPIVHRMKYGPRPSLARFFGELMVGEFGPELLGLELDGIIPIPLHPRRLRQRSFNQASLIARRIGKRLDMPVNEGSFIRERWTAPQVGLSRSKREANVRGAFQVVRPDEIRGGRWLLLDDVYTTGSTLKEASRTLRVAGAEAIHVLTLARVL